jgi:dienelactone hydrolase
LRSPEHAFAAHVSLPKGWKQGAEYPTLVCVGGEGIYFQGDAHLFADARKDREWIVVVPHALSSAVEVKYDRYPAYPEALIQRWNSRRVEFDEEGLVPLLAFLHEHFGAREKVAITGFSKGGRLCYRMLLRHPARIVAAVPASASFEAELANRAGAAEGGGAPVAILVGKDDEQRKAAEDGGPGVDAMTAEAVKALEAAGYARVERRLVEGGGHQPFADEVWSFLDEVGKAE